MSNMAGLVPAELENANYSGAGMRGAGALLGSVGQAAGMAGLMGAGPEWGDLFSNGGPVSSTVAGPTQQGFFNKMFG
jgi:hypothetical protein